MFKHIYFNSLKIFIREKTVIFWLLIFPMILSIFFKLAFSELADGENFEIIPVAVAETQESAETQQMYRSIFDQMSEMFMFTYTDTDEAKRLLGEGEVSAYLYIEDGRLAIAVNENGLNQSIIEEAVGQINEGVSLVMSGTVKQEDINRVMNVENVLNEVSLSGKKQDFIVAWFYTILGMAAMYGSTLGVSIIKYTQANQSSKAMRFNLAPVSKMKGFGAIFGAGATLHAVILTIVYLYVRYVMNIDFGDRYGYIILTTVVGGVTGISVGTAISVLLKKSEDFKVGVCMAVSMLGSYLAGMMDDTVKYKVMQNAPIVEKLNPAGILTDSYLKLYYYEDLSYYWGNVINLLVITAVCMSVTIFVLRRQRYDSI